MLAFGLNFVALYSGTFWLVFDRHMRRGSLFSGLLGRFGRHTPRELDHVFGHEVERDDAIALLIALRQEARLFLPDHGHLRAISTILLLGSRVLPVLF